jgi:hypothetical protein
MRTFRRELFVANFSNLEQDREAPNQNHAEYSEVLKGRGPIDIARAAARGRLKNTIFLFVGIA